MRSAARSTSAAGSCSGTCATRASRSSPTTGSCADRDGPLGARRLDRRLEDFLHFDHRKMVVVDGRVALRRRQRHRGPLQRRAVLRRHVPGDRPDRRPAPARVPGQLAVPGRAAPRRSRLSTATSRPNAPGRPGRRVDALPTTVLWNVPGRATTRSAMRSSSRSRRPRDADPHRQPVHRQPGDPGAPARGRPARRDGPARRPRQADAALSGGRLPPSLRAPARGRRRRSCSTPRWPTPRSCGSTTGCSSAAATSTTCACSGTTSWTCCSRRPTVVEPTERQVFDELVAMSVPATVPTGSARERGMRRWTGSREFL